MREREKKLIKVERCYKCACVNGNSKIKMGHINSWSNIASPFLCFLVSLSLL